MKTISFPALPLLALTGLLALSAAAGCATSLPPPIAQLALAKASVDNADVAGAPAYAPDESRRAADKLTASQKAMADEDFALALQLAEQAQLDAQVAMKKMHTAKARQATEVAQAARKESTQ